MKVVEKRVPRSWAWVVVTRLSGGSSQLLLREKTDCPARSVIRIGMERLSHKVVPECNCWQVSHPCTRRDGCHIMAEVR